MDTRELVAIGAVVLALVVVGIGFWLYQRHQRKIAENHYHLFRHRFWKGEDSALGEMVRQEAITNLKERVVILRGFLKKCQEQRYGASSVVDLQHDDVELFRELVNSAAADLKRAEDLEKLLKEKPAVVEKTASDSESAS